MKRIKGLIAPNIGKGRAIALIKMKSYPYRVEKNGKKYLCIDLKDLMPIIEGIYREVKE